MNKATKNTLIFFGIVIIVASIVAFIIASMTESDDMAQINVVPKEEEIQYFNTSEAIYVDAVPIEYLEKGWIGKFNINGELVHVETYHVIHDNETQKIHNETLITISCNENIVIGDQECCNVTKNVYTVFVHKNIKDAIIIHGTYYSDWHDYQPCGMNEL